MQTAKLLALSMALGFVAPAASQSVVVPSRLSTNEGVLRGRIAGFEAPFRQQVLLRGSILTQLRGKTLVALSFRRDLAFGYALQASTSRLRVRLSSAVRSPSAPSAVFATNRGANVFTVFDGVVALPASSKTTGPIDWSPQNVVRIPFRQSPAFRYATGPLCVDLEGRPILLPRGFFWSVDFESETASGKIRPIGKPCGIAARLNRLTATAYGRTLVPGSTFELSSVGRKGAAGVMMLASRLLAQPIPLGAFGATGCTMYLQPQVSVGMVYPPPFALEAYTKVVLPFQLPAQRRMLGANLFVQWTSLDRGSNALGISTTNALAVTVAPMMPPGRIATVTSDAVSKNAPFPATGRVEVSRGPVMRFEYR